jgi:hypothetical protein
MSSKRRTFIKSRAEELKILLLFVFLGLLGSGWFLYDFAKLVLLEIRDFIP